MAIAKRWCRNESDADDLVQEASTRFLQKYAQVANPESEASCLAWLATTINNLFFDQCRRTKVQVQGAQDPHLREEAVVTIEPLSPEVYDQIDEEMIDKAIQSLSPTLRTTYEMHVAGKKYQEIALALGIPVGTVGKRISDARAKLRDYLKRNTKLTDPSEPEEK